MPDVLPLALFIWGRDIQPAPVDPEVVPLLLQYGLLFGAGFQVRQFGPCCRHLSCRGFERVIGASKAGHVEMSWAVWGAPSLLRSRKET